jgi:hypothetical protein
MCKAFCRFQPMYGGRSGIALRAGAFSIKSITIGNILTFKDVWIRYERGFLARHLLGCVFLATPDEQAVF